MKNQEFSIKDLEPAEVHPKKLRAFAIKLLVVALVCAVVIIFNYKKNTAIQVDTNRPPRIHPIKNKLEVRTISMVGAEKMTKESIQIASAVSGKLSLILPISMSQPQDAQTTLQSVERVCQALSEEAKKMTQVVMISIEPEQDKLEGMLTFLNKDYDFSQVATTVILGPAMTPEKAEDTRDFIKKQLRMEPMYKDKNTYKWVFPTMVALIDTQKDFRGRYDFKEADLATQATQENYSQQLEEKLVAHLEYLASNKDKTESAQQ